MRIKQQIVSSVILGNAVPPSRIRAYTRGYGRQPTIVWEGQQGSVCVNLGDVDTDRSSAWLILNP